MTPNNRRPIIAGNWKMNLNHLEAAQLAQQIGEKINPSDSKDVVICPSFSSIETVSKIIEKFPLHLGAQNVHWERSGAFTGEVSTSMLQPLGVEYVIVGHSERRHIMLETNEMISKKLKLLVEEAFKPIFCVGETLEQRKSGQATDVIEKQLRVGLNLVNPDELVNLVIAYEPVWAIGTGENATVEEAEKIIAFIREILNDLENGVANIVRVQYGGSVTPENVDAFMASPEIDGVLVGGASLRVEKFLRIINYKSGITEVA